MTQTTARRPEPSAVRPLPAIRPGDRGLPLLGRALEYAKDPMALFTRQWEAYGPVSPFPMLTKQWVFLLGPDACEAALTNREKAFVSGPGWGEIVGPFFQRGLMFLDFEEHHLHRRIMQEAFVRPRLEGYVERMHPAIEEGLRRWRPLPDFRAYPELKTLTLGIAAEIFMGGAEHTPPAEMAQINKAFIDCVQAASGIVQRPWPFTRWGRATRSRAVLEEFLRSYLPARRAVESSDMLSRLCHLRTEDGERFSDDDVVNHMIFLMMAAHDTSTLTVTTILELLGKHPAWQERLRAEADAMPERPTLADLDAWDTMDRVMREALRLRAPVPVIVRKTIKPVVVCGVEIPADTFCSLAPQFSHLMPELWSDPLAFDPDRFGPERREDKSHRYAWEPFGGGVHKCLGLFFAGAEIKAITHHLLRGWTWSVDPDYVAPMNNHSLPFPSDGLPLDLLRRTS
ncbi:cytochrome P450 [Nocardioides sp. TRM66260-LWL]|uniref:cytochrome P450 n=1 Tax=Nocardioides sp. TRM66260-LWL TaxID=2874478 RepID=UPI001CC402BB|nr:cytochrome P450 [Nocardioides sp. TRM66260-LWL]MBZ5735479.1 cytochrome P450 [Nocardioides sp. TRM66260-LWL]